MRAAAENRRGHSERAIATRERLLETSRQVFGSRSLAAVRLKVDILEPAGVSVGSFYHQFRDKTDLLIAILDEHSAMIREESSRLQTPGPDRSPETIARDAYSFLFDIVDRDPNLMRIRLREEGVDDPRLASFLQRDAKAFRDSRVRDYQRLVEAYGGDVDVRGAAELVGLLVEGALRHYLRFPRSRRPEIREQLIEGLVNFTRGGLRGLEKKH